MTVDIEDDDLVEGVETFSLRISGSLPTGVVYETTQATARITDGDTSEASIGTGGRDTVSEGHVAMFPVTLTKAVSVPVTISYGVEGVDEDDYESSSELTIPAGQSTGTIAIRTIDDELLEPEETMTVTLQGVTPTGIGVSVSSTPVMINIAQSDGPVFVSLPETISVDEGDMVTVTVTLTAPLQSALEVEYSTSEDSPPDTDPADGVRSADGANNCNSDACDFTTVTGQLMFDPGETTATFEVSTRPDDLAEASETFRVILGEVSGLEFPPGVNFDVKEAVATITDDALTANVTGPALVEEGDSAEYTVTVNGGAGDEEVTVTYSTGDSTATAGEDFTPAGGTLTISGEERSGTFTIEVLDDQVVDLGETLVVSLEAVTADGEAVRAGAPARTMIVDDDGSVEVSITADQPIVAEGQQATFTLELTGTVAENVSLQYATGAVGDTATAGEDYSAAEADVVISAGAMSATITVATLPSDRVDEDDRILSVRLLEEGLPEGMEIGSGTARVTITDYALSASVTGPASVTEGESATFTVDLTGGDNRSDALVRYTWTAGTAQAPGDFDAPTGTLTILEGQTSGTITIVTKDDGVLDSGETLILTLTRRNERAGHRAGRGGFDGGRGLYHGRGRRLGDLVGCGHHRARGGSGGLYDHLGRPRPG